MDNQYSYFWNLVKDFQSIIILALGIVGYFIKTWIDNRNKCRIVASSILAEVIGIFDRYILITQGITSSRLEVGQYDEGSSEMILEISQNYFIVFENNADRIGFMDHKDVAAVIDFYISAKGLADTYTSMCQRHSQYNKIKFDVYKEGKQNDENIVCMMEEMRNDFQENMKHIRYQQEIALNKAQNASVILSKYVNQYAKLLDVAYRVANMLIDHFPLKFLFSNSILLISQCIYKRIRNK